jgi:cytochrome b561
VSPGRLRDPEDLSYSPIAQILHWVVVALLAIQFTLAWSMPGIGRDTVPETLINLHMSFGVLILLIATGRLTWRIIVPPPPALSGLPKWQLLASKWVHRLLYVLLFVIPLLGWLNASYRGFTVRPFGLVKLPALIASRTTATPGSFSWRWTGEVHIVLAYVLLGVIALHVMAAFYHHFILRNRTLARMLPGVRVNP